MNLLDLIKENGIPFEIDEAFPSGPRIFFKKTMNFEYRIFIIGYVEGTTLRFSCRTPFEYFGLQFENYETKGGIYFPIFLKEYTYIKEIAATYPIALN